ncbi:MAG: tRNA (adenosine(37)-N6)-threonylcarbamoyltransferase complex dimerization subunit type 1 TsaB [Pirellulales bacterium]
MKILAIDTSLAAGSIAAIDDAGATELPLGQAGEHARTFAARLVDAATQRGWGEGSTALADFGRDDLVAVVIGPGSFTGLRVGVTAAKTLAWTTGSRLVGVSGFVTVARRIAAVTGWHDAPLSVAFDAGRGEVHAAWATPAVDEPAGWRVSPPATTAADAWIASLPAGTRLGGPAATAERCGGRGDLACAPAEAGLPTAVDVAEAARLVAAAGRFDDPATLVPEYLRPSYAEERKPTIS